LRTILADLPIGGDVLPSQEWSGVLLGLEYFLPAVLREIHAQWDYESLDGIYPLWARKTGEREIELFGQCILISDQALAPIHLCLQIALPSDEVSWLECSLGEKGAEGMVRTPYESSEKALKRLYALEGGIDEIDWFYKVGFGERSF
jgi:hypothetical protein